MRRITALFTVLAVAALLGLAGCTAGGDDDASTTTTDASSATTTPRKNDPTTTTEDDDVTTTTTDDDDVTTTTTEDDDVTTTTRGDDGGSGSEQDYVDAIGASFERGDDDDLPLDDDQKACVSQGFVDVIGVDRFQAAGVSPSDIESGASMDFSELGLSESEGGDLYDVFGDCDVDLRQALLESMSSDTTVDPAMAACIEKTLDEDVLRDIMVAGFTKGDAAQNDPAAQEFIDALTTCAMAGMTPTT